MLFFVSNDSGVKRSCFKVAVAKCTKIISSLAVPNIPMSLIEQKVCSAEASRLLKSHIHGTKIAHQFIFDYFDVTFCRDTIDN